MFYNITCFQTICPSCVVKLFTILTVDLCLHFFSYLTQWKHYITYKDSDLHMYYGQVFIYCYLQDDLGSPLMCKDEESGAWVAHGQ